MPSARPSVTQASSGQPRPRGCSNLKLRQLDRVVSRHYDHHLAAVGLKTSQYSLLGHLAAMEPVRPADLATAMHLDASTLTRNLRPLLERGWVHSTPGADARTLHLSLTEDGRAIRLQAQRAWKKAQLAFNERVGAERVVALHALLDDCLQCMTADTAAP